MAEKMMVSLTHSMAMSTIETVSCTSFGWGREKGFIVTLMLMFVEQTSPQLLNF